jgi:hypothetical protein
VRNPTAYAEIERWFLKRGLPHFIDGYSARRDVLTRALPVLTFIFLVEVVNAPKKSFSIWLDVVAVVGGFAILLGAWAVVNRLRHRRPLQRPDDIGIAEVCVFVFVPALLPIVFGQQYASAGVTAAVNMVLVALVYFTTSYGVVPTVRWGIGKIGVQLEAISALLVRALPLLALFVTFFFLTAEVWQSAGITTGAPYWMAIGLFVAVGVFFVLMRMPADLHELGTFSTWGEVGALVKGTPAEQSFDDGGDPTAAITLSRRQRVNVVLVVLFSQAVQIVFVSVAVGLFFSVLGLMLVPRATIASWTGIEPDALHVLLSWHVGDRELLITDPTLRVAGFVTAFAGLQFTMSVLTDAHYRAEFREEVVGEIRQAFAVRAVYLDQRADAKPSP